MSATIPATWQLLRQYDKDALGLPKKEKKDGGILELDMARGAITSLCQDLLKKTKQLISLVTNAGTWIGT